MSAFTKLLFTMAITLWAFMLPIEMVAMLLVIQLAIFLFASPTKSSLAAIGALVIFTGVMILLQMLFNSNIQEALVSGLKMLVMTTSFLCLLATTYIQDLALVLVERFKLPREYAFMLTTALRFVPDFLTDSQMTLDAQSCRGYCNRGNIFKRALAYLAIVRPLVMRAINKSETLALSMQLKGFGSSIVHKKLSARLQALDYASILLMLTITARALYLKHIQVSYTTKVFLGLGGLF